MGHDWVVTFRSIVVHNLIVLAIAGLIYFAFLAKILFEQRKQPYFAKRGIPFLVLVLIFCFAISAMFLLREMQQNLPYFKYTSQIYMELTSFLIVSTIYGTLSVIMARIFHYHINIFHMKAASRRIKQIDLNFIVTCAGNNKVTSKKNASNMHTASASCESKLLQLHPIFATILKLATFACMIWLLETSILAMFYFAQMALLRSFFSVFVGMFCF